MLEGFKPKKFELRPYQKKAVEAGVEFFKNGVHPSVIVMPTGSGKSVIIASIVDQLEGKTIIFQPSKEILEQNFEKFMIYSDSTDVGIYSASVGEKQVNRIVFATIGSVTNCKDKFSDYQNIIIDECHFVNSKGGMYEDFIKFVGSHRVLGLTATPYRLANAMAGSMLRFITRTNPRIFKEVIAYAQISELKQMGFLADLKYYPIIGFDTSKVQSNSTGADYSDRSLMKYFKEIKFDNTISDVVKRLVNAGRKNILVFTKFTDEAKTLVRALGEIACIVTAETKKKDREQILANFKAGKIKVIANVGVLTTGFDFPELETVVIARPTKSLGLYYQMVGRGLRPHKDKSDCWIVDMCQNQERFGKVEELELKKGKEFKGFFTENPAGQWYVVNKGKPLTNVLFK